MALEIDCGGCCKKVLNVGLIGDIPEMGLTDVLPPEGERLFILTFNHGNLVDLQSAEGALVLAQRICSIERNVSELPPPAPSTLQNQTVQCAPVSRSHIDMSKKC